MLAMQAMMTVLTAQCFFDLRGTRLERMIRKPVLVEGEYSLRIPPCDSSHRVMKHIATTLPCVLSQKPFMVPTTV